MTDKNFQRQIFKAIEDIPLLSPTASRLLQTNADPQHEMGAIIQIVKCDAILTARLLRVVNSAAFGLLVEITSLDRAVSYLGERMVVGIAIADSSAGLIFTRALEGYEAEAGVLWRHDLFCAIASRAVARFARVEFEADLAFTAGLLHDLGKAIVSEYLHGTSREVLKNITSGNSSDYLSAEQQLLGLDHARVGFELARSWKLPVVLQQIILHHHHPQEAEESLRPLVYAVHLGDILAMMGGQGTGSDTMQYHLDQGYTEYFDISNKDLACLLLEATEEFHKLEAALAIVKEPTP